MRATVRKSCTSSGCARTYLLGKDASERRAVPDRVKVSYRGRSKIVHGDTDRRQRYEDYQRVSVFGHDLTCARSPSCSGEQPNWEWLVCRWSSADARRRLNRTARAKGLRQRLVDGRLTRA